MYVQKFDPSWTWDYKVLVNVRGLKKIKEEQKELAEKHKGEYEDSCAVEMYANEISTLEAVLGYLDAGYSIGEIERTLKQQDLLRPNHDHYRGMPFFVSFYDHLLSWSMGFDAGAAYQQAEAYRNPPIEVKIKGVDY